MKINCVSCKFEFETSSILEKYYCPCCAGILSPFRDGIILDRQVKEGLDFLKKCTLSTDRIPCIHYLRNNGFWMASSWIENNPLLYKIYLERGEKLEVS